MDLVGFNYFIHCSQLSVFFFFLNKKDFQSMHAFPPPLLLLSHLLFLSLFTFVANGSPFWAVHKILEGKKDRKSCHESQCRIK